MAQPRGRKEMRVEETKVLIERYLEITESAKNQKNREYWENADEPYLLERWRGRSARRTKTPVTMAMDISGYVDMVGINCAEYYQIPEIQLRDQLRYAIWEAENFGCHRYFEPAVFIGMGSVLEASLFGAPIHYLPKQAPWYDEKNPVFADKSALLRVKPFDFHHSGLCEKIHQFYETYNRLTAGTGIDVMFPLTMRSPFSIAIMLRGFENLLLDIYDDPDFFHALLRTILEFLKEYTSARAAFLGTGIPRGLLFNDEISGTVISNAVYEEMILPYEIEWSEYCGGLRYWHSCGETQNFYESICTIPNLQMMHIGPWSDVAKAAEVFGARDIALEICVNSIRDMYEKTESEMIAQLTDIRAACDGRVRYSVRCDGIAVLSDRENCMDKMREWNRAALEVFPG